MPELPCLTIHQPYASAIALGHKPIENRGWPPPPWLIGKVLGIHASKTIDDEGLAICRKLGFHLPVDEMPCGSIIAVGTVIETTTASVDRWFIGPFGWVLANVIPITPIPCRGYQKIWRAPPITAEAVFAAVAEHERKARHG